MRSIRSCLFIVGAVLFSSIAFAQVGTQGTIAGTVTDASGALIPGAQITVVEHSTQLKRDVISNSRGSFEVPALPIGDYSVTVGAKGMKTWKLENLRLTIGATQSITPVLDVGTVSEVVNVQASQELQTTSNSVQTILDVPTLLNFPNSSRNPLQYAQLTPGISYSASSGPEGGAQVSGTGIRGASTSFTLDGVNINAPMDNGAIGVPLVDDIAEMSVEPSSASADAGRDPMQIKLVTKSGTNKFHGSAWEYFQNDALNARYSFLSKTAAKPKLRFNQFGGNLGGPIFHDKFFFYGSFQETLNPATHVYNEYAPLATNYDGNFASGVVVKDPLTGLPFPNGPGGGSTIPANRINPASKYLSQFLPVGVPVGNSSLFQAESPTTLKVYQSSLRLDYNLSQKQRIYARDIALQNRSQDTAWLPSVKTLNSLDQNTISVNYNYIITPHYLLTVTAGFLTTANWFSSPDVGKVNYAENAGIQGIPTKGRESDIGMPTLYMSGGYPGTAFPFGLNGKLWGDAPNTDITLTISKGKHTINAGYSLLDDHVYGRHSSSYGRGFFGFYGAYSGNQLGDFLMGYAGRGIKNLPLAQFGLDRALLHGIHADDSWKIFPNLTINVGLRYEYWAAPHFVAGNAVTWDPKNNIIVAGEDNGKVNLDHQPSAQAVAAATAGLWVPMSAVGVDHMLPANGHIEPRIGFNWQPITNGNIVVRGGYGVFENNFTGNRAASTIGAIPFFALQDITEGTAPQDYRTMFPPDPSNFQQPAVNNTTSLKIDAARTQEWNLAVQTAMPLGSTLTVGYIGNKAMGLPVSHDYNAPPPGKYANLVAAQLHPAYGAIKIMENGADTWFHGLSVKWQKNYSNGLYFLTSYMWSKSMSNHAYATGELSAITPYAPAWYERGATPLDRRNNLKVTAIYELPVGRGRTFFANTNWLLDEVVGGWNVSGYYAYESGDPIAISQPGVSLGNGYGTRPNLVGNPNIGNPSKTLWFNPAAFANAAPYTFGNSGASPVVGPPLNYTSFGLMKNFKWTEGRYLQVRADAFNALNHVNLNDPNATLGSPTTGKILGAADARTVQLGARIVF